MKQIRRSTIFAIQIFLLFLLICPNTEGQTKHFIWLHTDKNTQLWTKEVYDLLKGNIDGCLVTAWIQKSADFGEPFDSVNNIYSIGNYDPKYAHQTCYISEMYANGQSFDLRSFPKLLADEPSILLLDKYLDLNCNVTFSGYKWYPLFLESWFGIRLWLPWTNQIWAWEKLENTFQERFNCCWIHLTKNKNDFTELLTWCKNKGKRVMLYAGDDDITKDDFLECYPIFLNAFNTVFNSGH